ncbi:hypothetical protein LNO75_03885, partial [Mycoplasma sp. T363T]|uniref:hypothetical protein n=1 Tax=Mycoplasma bradburyae TaxID=2963128 RepID=UPI0023425135
GAAKLISLYKKAGNDWQGNYYLTSKDDSNYKLIIKSKKIADFSLEVPGIVLQDLLPDSVKVFVSKIDNEMISVDGQSNLQAYINQIETEKAFTTNHSNADNNNKYKYDNNLLTVDPVKVSSNDPQPKPVILNPIKVKNINSDVAADKILFKAQYLFDGTGVFNGDVFSTNLKFKKALKWDNGASDPALKSEYLSNIWYGVNYIPGMTSAEINFNGVKDKSNLVVSSFKTGPNNSEYFNKTLNIQNAIKGEQNSKTGVGVAQLIQNDEKSRGRGQEDFKNKINQNSATNYVVFSRIAYKKSNDSNDYNYLWSNTVTILYVEGPMAASTHS